MAKRFTDSEKWERPWFRKLPNEYKLFWIYLLDKCDSAGFWYVDIELASFLIGEIITEENALKYLGKQIKVLANNKWQIVDFVTFQYGKLVPNNNLHRSVLEKIGKNPLGASEGLVSPLAGDKDKDKVIVKDKVIDVKGIVKGFEYPKPEEVTDYAKQIGFVLDGRYFCDYYEARGWEYKRGQKMRSWKAAVRTWKINGGSNVGKGGCGKGFNKGDNTAGTIDTSKYDKAGIAE